MSSKNKALSSIIICVIIWGFSFISTKITVQVFPPMSLGLLRFAVALIVMFIIKIKFAPGEKLRVRDIPLLSAAGLTGVTLYFFFENNGVFLVSASEASIAISSIPALIMIADFISGKIARNAHGRERADGAPAADGTSAAGGTHAAGVRQWFGCFISIAGVWLVAGVSFAVSGSILGYVYMTGAALSWVAYSLLTRPLFKNCSRIYIVFWQTAAGFICFIPFSIHEIPLWGKADAQVIIHLLFLGILCSAVGYWLYARAMENLGVSGCGIFLNLVPVITAIAGFFMLGDRLSSLQILGAALVISGVYLAIWKKKT